MRSKLASFLAVFILAGAAAGAEQYQIDPSHSSASFWVRHLAVSRVPGRFGKVTGTIIHDEADITRSSVEATIDAASINTDHAKRDEDLRGPEFFDVAKYPTITFRSNRVERRRDQLVAIGTLTIKNVSKEIELPFTLEKGRARGKLLLGVQAETRLDRFDYNVSWSRLMEGGGLVVGREVRVELNLEAARPDPAAKPGQ